MNFKLGEAYVELTVKDAGYLAGLSKAENALKGLATRVSSALSAGALSGLRNANALLGRMSTQGSAAAASMKGLASSINGVTSATKAMNAALGGRAGGAGVGALLKAQGQAQGSVIRAQGAAMASQIRAGGSVAAAAVKGAGSAVAMNVRAAGAGAGNVIRSAGGAASGVIRALATPIRAITAPLTATVNAAGRLLGSRGAMLGGLGAGLGAGFSLYEAGQQAVDMETAMMKLGRASGLTGVALEKVGNDFRRFASTNAGVALDQVFQLGTIGAKLGIQGPQLSLFTRDLSKMGAVLEDIPAEEAATRIARLTSIFGRGNDEAIRFASALNKLDLMSAATARDILEVTTRFAPQAAFFKMKPHEAMALATATRQAGTPVETAGTSLSQMFGKMASRKEMGQFARIAGQPMERFSRTLQTMPLKAIQQVAEGIRRIADADPKDGIKKADRALDKLGLDGYRTRITLLGLTTVLPQLTQYTSAAGKDWNSLDSILKSFQQQGATAASQLVMMKNNVAILAGNLGRSLLPAIKGFAEGVVGLTRDISRWAESNKELFETWGKNIGNFFRDLGALPRTWGAHLKLIRIEAQEKMEQLIQIFKNTREPLIQSFVWLAETASTVFGATLGKGARKAGVDFARTLTESIVSGLEQLPGGDFLIKRIFGGDAKSVRTAARAIADAQKNAIDAQKFQLPPAPKFAMADLFKNLPSREAEKRPLRAQIGAGQAAQQRERADEQASDIEEDAMTRIQASEQRSAQRFTRLALRGYNQQQARQRQQPWFQERQARQEFIQRERWERQNQIRMFRGQAPVEFEPRERRATGMPGGGNLLPQQNREPLVQGVDEVAKNTSTTNEKLDRLLDAIEGLNMGLV